MAHDSADLGHDCMISENTPQSRYIAASAFRETLSLSECRGSNAMCFNYNQYVQQFHNWLKDSGSKIPVGSNQLDVLITDKYRDELFEYFYFRLKPELSKLLSDQRRGSNAWFIFFETCLHC